MTEKMKKLMMDLRDDSLSELLKETYNADPALQPAPERSERIMRHILAARPVAAARGWQWLSFAWAGGALALGSLAVAMFMATHVSAPPNTSVATAQPKHSVTTPAPVSDSAPEIVPIAVPQQPEVATVADTTVPAPKKRAPKVPAKQTPEDNNTTFSSITPTPATPNAIIKPAAPTKDAFANTSGLAGMNEMANAYLASGDVEGALLAMEIKRGQDADPDTDLAIARLLTDNADEISL